MQSAAGPASCVGGYALTKPIWHSPAWITAIVGLVGVFLTIPERVGNYFEKQQEITHLEIQNLDSRQEHELNVALNTLAQQGDERVFLLRYLAATHDDADAKKWAEGEVARLDKIADLEELSKQKHAEVVALEGRLQEEVARADERTEGIDNLGQELKALQIELSEKNSEITELRQKAGLSDQDDAPRSIHRIRVEKNPEYVGNATKIFLDTEAYATTCHFVSDYCERLIPGTSPYEISISSTPSTNPDINKQYDNRLFGSMSVKTYELHAGPYFSIYGKRELTYNCEYMDETILCVAPLTFAIPHLESLVMRKFPPLEPVTIPNIRLPLPSEYE